MNKLYWINEYTICFFYNSQKYNMALLSMPLFGFTIDRYMFKFIYLFIYVYIYIFNYEWAKRMTFLLAVI